MRYRLLGRTGLRVSELFLGAMTFGAQGFGATKEESRRILDLYAEAGGNLVDTANFYAGGQSESMLGELLEGRRDPFVVATKYTVSRDGGDPNAAGSHRKNLTLSLEESLRRLRTDYLDLYWVNLWPSGGRHDTGAQAPVPSVARSALGSRSPERVLVQSNEQHAGRADIQRPGLSSGPVGNLGRIPRAGTAPICGRRPPGPGGRRGISSTLG